MRTLFFLILAASAIAFLFAYGPIVVRRLRARKGAPPPAWAEVPARAVHLAREDERMREAVEIRNRIAELARKPEVGLGDVVVREVDDLVDAMVSLYDTKTALGRHLVSISEARIERDEGLLDPVSVAAQRRQLADLRQREKAFETELARAVAGLRETWLGLLDAIAKPGGGLVAAERVRQQIETLRIRIQAEREARTEVEDSMN